MSDGSAKGEPRYPRPSLKETVTWGTLFVIVWNSVVVPIYVVMALVLGITVRRGWFHQMLKSRPVLRLARWYRRRNRPRTSVDFGV